MRRSISAIVALTFAFVLSFGVSVATADPMVVTLDYTWEGEDPDEPDLSKLTWFNSGTSDIVAVDECDVGLFTSCDTFPGESAPMVSADPTDTFNEGDYAGWVFKAPGGPDVYFEHVVARGVNVTGPDALNLESNGPLGFLALREGDDLVVGEGTEGTAPFTLDEDGGPGVDSVLLGIGINDQPFAQKRWTGLKSMEVTLGDDVAPVATIDAPTGWIDETPTTIPVEAEDGGLGLTLVLYRAAKRNPAHLFDFATVGKLVCEMLIEEEPELKDLCPRQTPTGFELPLNPANLREGYTNLFFQTGDMHDNSDDQTIPIKIDTQQPSVSLGGSFTTAPGMVLDGALYELEVDAADGNATVHNSGVKKIQVLVDNVEIDSDTQACPGDDCEMELDTDIEPDNWANGEHQLKVKVTDQVGHVKTTTVDFEVDR